MPRRFLILPPITIDEVVFASGAFAEFVKKHRDPLLTLAYESRAGEDIFENLGNVEFIFRNRRSNLRSSRFWFPLLKKTCLKLWHKIVILNTVTFPLCLILRLRTIIAKSNSCPSHIHKVHYYTQKLTGSKKPIAPFLPIDERHRTKAKELFPSQGEGLILCPTSDGFVYDWPVEHYISLVQALIGKGGGMEGASVFLIGNPVDRQNILYLLDAIPKAQRFDCYGRGHDLLTLAACMERGRLIVGGDNGYLHLGAATYKAPTLGLYGPSSEKHQGPWGSHAHIMRPDVEYGAWDFLRHSMAMLRPEDVLKKVEEILLK